MSSVRSRIGAISRPDESSPAEAAAYWHARLAGEGATAPEFEQWRNASADHQAAFDRVSARHDGIRALADMPEILSLRHQTLARLSVKREADRRARIGAGVAAVALLIAVPFAAMQSGYFAPSPGEKPVATVASAEQSFRTAVGQRMTLNLTDGSRVVLNTASRIRVAYTPQTRQLALDAGQAWFEVAKDKARPFIVHAGGRQVEAHGTAFDVRVLPGRTEVMLAEGRVTVTPDARPGAGVAMQPNQLLIASPGGTTVRRVANLKPWSNWRSGVVRFDGVPLAEAVGEMNRYSDTKLRIADAATGRIVVSGSFDAGATQAFVEALAIGFDVRAQRDAAGNLLLKSAR